MNPVTKLISDPTGVTQLHPVLFVMSFWRRTLTDPPTPHPPAAAPTMLPTALSAPNPVRL